MSKKMLYKDAWQSIGRSPGRFIALVLLMLLGTFSFVGLKITGPDMRQTGMNYFNQTHLADMTVTSAYGLNQADQKTITDQAQVKTVNYGYFTDAKIKGSTNSIRVFSNSGSLSQYKVVAGRLAKTDTEIALNNTLKGTYHLGETITLQDGTGLAKTKFKVVGFVKSAEFINHNDFGQTSVGTGQLSGFGVTTKRAFSLTEYNLARISYRDTAKLNAYSNAYTKLMNKRQATLLKDLNQHRAAKYQAAKASLANQAKAAATQLAKQEYQLNNLGYPTYTVNTRSDFPGYEIYRSNAKRVDVLANVFPTFLFAIATLVALTTMMRFVEEERITIGTLKALSYSNADVALKFLLYSLLASGLGVILGALGGFTLLPKIVFEAYAASSTITGVVLKFSWTYLAIAVLIAVCSTTVAALYALSHNFKERPAALLLPKPPKAGSRILLERVTPLWKRLSFNHKVTFRNLFRYKSRALMTIFGIAGCVGLLVMGIGIRDSLAGIADQQYSQIIKYDLLVAQKSAPTASQTSQYDQLLAASQVKNHHAIYTQQYHRAVGKDQSTQAVTMIVPNTTKNFNQSVTLLSSATGKAMRLPKTGVILTQKMATLLEAKKGATIYLKDANGNRQSFQVKGIAQMYMGHFIFMSKTAYQKLTGQTYHPNAQLVTLRDNSSSNVKKLASRFIQTGAVATTSLNLNNKELIGNIINGLNTVIAVLIGISTLLAIVVLYNLTNINVSERIRELSTIKVLGFFDQEVTMYIYRETIILTILGIFFGYFFGMWLHSFIMINLPPDNAMFDNTMHPANFVISTVIPALITLILAFVIHRKIKRVNMLDALQSVD
ncbi:ABC transporter permease [Limosilactobacillus fermentum]|uniref:ABC transporter permease n=1 Tax=Limosilactobacillus fermentum TaxID=1613 RepID=UPI002F2635D6